MTLVGVSGSDIIWKALNSDWLSVLGKHGAPFLHTTDAVSRKKDFEDWEEVRVDALISDCVSVIEKHASVRRGKDWLYQGLRPAAVTVSIDDFRRALELHPELGHPEEICAVHATAGCQAYGLFRGYRKIHCFYDQNEKFRGYIENRRESKKAKEYIPLLPSCVHTEEGDMRDSIGLQAADLFTWTINRTYYEGPRQEWQRRLLAIDRDEEHFSYERLCMPNLERLAVTRSWDMPKRRPFK
jgi:uncharacterized protein YejL (UPF0352 family)